MPTSIPNKTTVLLSSSTLAPAFERGPVFLMVEPDSHAGLSLNTGLLTYLNPKLRKPTCLIFHGGDIFPLRSSFTGTLPCTIPHTSTALASAILLPLSTCAKG